MPVSQSAEVLALKQEDAAAVSTAPIGLKSLNTGLHSLVNLAKLTKTIGTITDFWHYIR